MNMMNGTMLSIALDMVLEQGRCPDCMSAIELEKETEVFETLNFTGFQQECGVCGGVLNVTVRLKGAQVKGEVLCNGEEWNLPPYRGEKMSHLYEFGDENVLTRDGDIVFCCRDQHRACDEFCAAFETLKTETRMVKLHCCGRVIALGEEEETK